MRITAVATAAHDAVTADAVIVPRYRDGTIPDAARSAVTSGVDFDALGRRSAFRQVGDICRVTNGAPDGDVVVVDVGPGPTISPADLRTAGMRVARELDHDRVVCTLATASSDADADAIVAEALVIGSYSFDRYCSVRDRVRRIPQVLVPGANQAAIDTGVVIGECTNRTRDLVNTPARDLTPEAFADECRSDADRYGFTCRVLRSDELVAGGFGAIVAVGAGSANPPVLIELSQGGDDQPATALVGKGITFDSGGLAIKDREWMSTMKMDMAGAASVLATFIACRRLGVERPLRGYLACAENLPSGTATRPGDVVRHRNGLTTEVVNPDAEGRLVLGDALAYAAESAPARIVDVATLTGATALGPDLWGILGTDRGLVADLLAAGAAGGEPGWELPLWDGYRKRVHSEIADVKNSHFGIRWKYGAMLGALYLREFVADVPWAHLDIAATAMRESADKTWAAGATGSSTRTLVQYLMTPTAQPRDVE